MICFGAVLVEPTLQRTFYGKLKPMSEQWIAEALAVSGSSCDDVLTFEEPAEVMTRFADGSVTTRWAMLWRCCI